MFPHYNFVIFLRCSYKPDSVLDINILGDYLSKNYFTIIFKQRAKNMELLTYSFCYELGLHSDFNCLKSGELLPRRFTLTKIINNLAVYFLLHFPLSYDSHLLDGIPLHCSPDFPLKILSNRPLHLKLGFYKKMC